MLAAHLTGHRTCSQSYLLGAAEPLSRDMKTTLSGSMKITTLGTLMVTSVCMVVIVIRYS